MLEEPHGHGYNISSRTLYPILHSMESDGLLIREDKNVEEENQKILHNY